MGEKTKQIIVIPGIMGSKLKQGLLRIWPSYVGHLRHKTFFGEKLKYKENDKTVADGPFKLFYQKLVNNLEQSDAYVDVFSYDWRKNNLDQLSLLEDIVRTDVDEIYIVAHSMGGIVAKLFLNYYRGSEKVKNIKKLITLGTPWYGSPDAYKMIFYGVENQLLLLMSKDNSKDIITTFPSVYQLLPDSNYITKCLNENKPAFLEEDGNKLSWHDIYNYKYLSLIENHELDENKIFREYYNLKNQGIDVEHHEIIGYGLGTLYSIIKNSSDEAICEFNTGDETVPICSANSNAPYQYFIKEKHQKLVENNTALSIIKSIINDKELEESIKVERNYDKASQYKFTGKIFRVACPVIVSLIDEDKNIIYGNIDFDENPNISLLDESDYNVVQIDNILYLLLENDEHSLTNNENKIKKLEKLYIEAYDEGPVSISIEEFDKGKIKKVAAFNSFKINSDISVELSIKPDIDNSAIIINEIGKECEIKKAVTTSVDENNADVILPQTKFQLLGDKIVCANDNTTIFTADKLKLKIDEVIKGTNPVLDTMYILNGENRGILTQGEETEIEFEPNSKINVLKIYSVDSMGNVEKAKTIRIYFIEDKKPNININFYSTHYTFNIEDSNKDILESYGIEISKPIISLNKENGTNQYTENNFEYTNIINNISIKYTNMYNTNYDFTIPIHENKVIAILQGENNPDMLTDLLKQIGLKEPYDKKSLYKYQGKGTLRTINAENIYNSKIINIIKDNFDIYIYKEFRDIVSFQSLMEDIKLEEQGKYKFEFKVIDTVTAKEINNLNLRGYIQVNLDNSSYNMYDIDIKYDEKTSNYIGLIDIPQLRIVLSQTTYFEERVNGIKNASLIIEQISEINTKIRIHPITIR
ncbi:acyltransferase [Clostridium sp. ZBS18]|uniref:lipase/acyltransferase domain-containing protein n=1 Tax=Clostridium sp. ZBS18 TaxID=2949967 RepID=UPI00207B094A|nr:acyltransferase [Clostridium sp. ZBS18]